MKNNIRNTFLWMGLLLSFNHLWSMKQLNVQAIQKNLNFTRTFLNKYDLVTTQLPTMKLATALSSLHTNKISVALGHIAPYHAWIKSRNFSVSHKELKDAFLMNRESIKNHPDMRDQFIAKAVQSIDSMQDDVLESLFKRYPVEFMQACFDAALKTHMKNPYVTFFKNENLFGPLGSCTQELINYCFLAQEDQQKQAASLLNTIFYTLEDCPNIGSDNWKIYQMHAFDCRPSALHSGLGRHAGTMKYMIKEADATISSLEINKALCSRGIGGALFAKGLHDIEKKIKCGTIRLSALPIAHRTLEMNDLVRFYQKHGFEIEGTCSSMVNMKREIGK